MSSRNTITEHQVSVDDKGTLQAGQEASKVIHHPGSVSQYNTHDTKETKEHADSDGMGCF